MLDENLPTFHLKPSSDNPLSSTIFLSEHGSELQPEYTFRRPDPKLPGSKNCYAVALYDSYNPDVLYAEVLVNPEWQQPTLSAAEIRAQNGIPPPPIPIVPNQFAIQLYNPDQQVIVRQIPGTTFTTAHWEFEMPQTSFRTPSASALDRSQSDPAASDITPKIAFKWKRDGKLSKDISCFLYGKSTDGKKSKDPDITVAFYKNSNLTIYQPNMSRVEVEDTKGLEVVLILGAAVIKDIYFNASRELFNIGSPGANGPTNTKRKNSGPVIGGKQVPAAAVMSGAVLPTVVNVPASQILPQQPPRHAQQSISRPPAADPRTQWEIDAETERLKKIVQAEEKAREKAEKAEEKRILKMLEEEDRQARKRQAEVEKETERLRREYGVPANGAGPSVSFSPAPPQRPQQQGMPQWQSAPHSQPVPVSRPQSTPSGQGPSVNTWLQRPTANSPYLQAPGNATASSSGFFGLGGKKVQKKRSVFF